MEFASKEYFGLLILLIPYILWYFLYRNKREPTMLMSDTFAYRYAPKSWRMRLDSSTDVVALCRLCADSHSHGSSTDS